MLSDKIGKGDEAALEVLRGIMLTSTKESNQLRAALAWLGLSMDTRKQLHKVAMDVKAAKAAQKEPEVHEFDEEEATTPIISMVATTK